jgi:P-type E1-E2 ATPase
MATKWRDVKVGDIIMVVENEFLPVDLVILRTSADNLCYIETKNLDGETNLKHKQAP